MFITDEQKKIIKDEIGEDIRGFCDHCGKPYRSTDTIVYHKFLGRHKTYCSNKCLSGR